MKLTRRQVTRRPVAGTESWELSNDSRAQNSLREESHETASARSAAAVRSFERSPAKVGCGRKPLPEVRPKCHPSQATRHEQQLRLATRPQQEIRLQVFSSGRKSWHPLANATSLFSRAVCCLTLRSSGAPTAGHQHPASGTPYIFTVRVLASCRCRPHSSYVRPRNHHPGVSCPSNTSPQHLNWQPSTSSCVA